MTAWQFDAYRQIFRLQGFRRFWLGFTCSELGDAMTRVALTWYVWESTHSAEALGWLALAYTGPVIVGGLVAGAFLDRFDKRKVMLADNVIRGAAIAAIQLLYSLHMLALWQIYLVAAVYGSLMMVSLAGGPALIPALVPRQQLATANALETLTFTLGGVLGPAAAGLLIAGIGAPNVLILDAASYAVFAFALAGIQFAPEDEAAVETPAADTPASTLWNVAAFTVTNRVLLSTTVMFAAANLGLGFLFVWLPVLASGLPGGGPELYGLLSATMAAGEVAGSVVAGSRALRLPLGTAICLAQALSGLALSLLLLSQSLGLALPALALLGCFSAPLTIWAQTLRMQIIPASMRGRTFAFLRTLMQSTPPLGGALAGLILPLLGVPALIALSTLIVGAPGLLGYGVADLRTAGAPGADQDPLRTGSIDYTIGE
jgi:MFS family permease